MSDIVRDFLVDIAENHIIVGKKYSLRIKIEDGGINSYIGLDVDVNDFDRKTPTSTPLRLFRHTNSNALIVNTWGFSLGTYFESYFDSNDIPLYFGSYGKTQEEAEAEATEFFRELKRIIRKKTAEIKLEAAKSAEEEKERLLARLSELEDKA